jgi:hypothetical protein
MNTSQLKRVLFSDVYTKRQYGNVCPADRLPTIVRHRPRLYIVNTDVSGSPGTHWVAFYFPKRGPVEFFDPVGHKPEYYHNRFKHVLLVNGTRYLYSGHRVQGLHTLTCGPFCLYFALHRCRGWSFKKIMHSFSITDLLVNEEKVFDLIDVRRV